MYVCNLFKSGNKLKSGKEMTLHPYLKGFLPPVPDSTLEDGNSDNININIKTNSHKNI